MTRIQSRPRALLLGGTGAMGVYLQDELVSIGWDVLVTSRNSRTSRSNVTFLKGNAKDPAFLKALSKERYDVVIDFMTWTLDDFKDVMPVLLEMAGQYVFLSSYRVFAYAPVITETSPKLLNSCPDKRYVKSDEYAIVKACEENQLRDSGVSNWTIVRPAITYSKERFQLGTLEAHEWFWRAFKGFPVPMAQEILEKECTLTWGHDVARMIARLLGNPAAYGEDFNVSTSKHQSWQKVLSVYRSIFDFDVRVVPLEIYERYCCWGDSRLGYCPQLRYDRLVDRILDNSKVLAVTGIDECELASTNEGLFSEFYRFVDNPTFPAGISAYAQGGLDRACGNPAAFAAAVTSDRSLVRGVLRYMKGWFRRA